MNTAEAEADGDALSLLHPLIKELLARRGITALTEPQRRAIPLIMEGRNVLIISPTGSGKTEAAILPVLSMFLRARERGELGPGINILYITPLRALNRDLLDRLSWWGGELGMEVAVRHGDTDANERSRQSRRPPQMLITTPETLQLILTGRRLREHVKSVKWIIIDEVHELAEDKRGVQLSLTLEVLKWLIGSSPQLIGLSATIGSPREVARFLVGEGDAEVVDASMMRRTKMEVIGPAAPPPDPPSLREDAEELIHKDALGRLLHVKRLIDEGGGATIVFVNTRSMAELLAFRFSLLDPGYPVAVHHSSLSKVSRINVERLFKDGGLKAIIATSSLELGIDIGRVDQVIQYLSPHQVTRLVQRVGRSGHRLDRTPRGFIVTEDLNDTLEAEAIIGRARRGWIEPLTVPEKPFDVLVHQIVLLMMIRNRWSLGEIHSIFSRSYPYRGLSMEELRGVVKFMSEVLNPRLVYFVDGEDVVLKPSGRRARMEMYRYFFDQLSMIPEEQQYVVIREDTEEPVGVLDDAFIAEYGQVGVKFVFRGSVWILSGLDEDKVYVRPTEDPVGAIPSWIGEEIPVPREVAEDVGRIKARLAEAVRRGEAPSRVAGELGLGEEVASYALDFVRRQAEVAPVPTHEEVVVEEVGDLAVVHAHFGTLINRTLARMLSELITRDTGFPVAVQQDPYSVVIQLPRGASRSGLVEEELVKLASLGGGELIELVRSVALRTGLLRRRFMHVARRFNVLSKKRSWGEVNMGSVIEALRDTPVFTEAFKEFLVRDVDLDGAARVLARIKSGEVRIRTVRLAAPSPMAQEIIDKISHKMELIAPERLDKLVLESVKARLLNESLTLVCRECGSTFMARVRDAMNAKCPQCGSARLGAVKLEEGKAADLAARVREGRVRKGDRRHADALERSTELVARHGWRAMVVLASRLPLDEAEALLEKTGEAGLDELAAAIYGAEREHMRRRFLSNE
ncbi:DEAD/DEAH box helicase [Thermocladium modestius]|nr:DEAD/DEAH box helicase [Thermocladium modestius]